jgi:hypothetical protein
LLAQVAVGLKSSLGIVKVGLYLGHLRIGRGLLLRYFRVGLMSVVGSVDISLKDDVTVILLLGVSFIATTLGRSMSRIYMQYAHLLRTNCFLEKRS